MTEQETRPVTVEDQLNDTLVNNTNDDAIKTVFHDPKNYNVKHPLQNTWTLWFDNPGKKASTQSWSQNLKEVVDVDTVEDFWGVHNNIAKVNALEISSNYHIFKKGIRPEWEDPVNSNGGKFSVQLPRGRIGEHINEYWLNLILAMLGEQFTYEDEICGAVVSVRKVFYRISLWIKSSERNERVESVGRQFKEFLNAGNNSSIEFTPHGDSAAKSGDSKFVI
ncbi:translation initiation factor eIF 4e-like domain-containing protein [Pilobolus umbonatus]|nr:translation initiation factor eIF 4e-like domain-containing protein [Pilobolus umbonatus]